ncbi:MAG: sulfatase-like hydrolase/transferase, partial [Anaerolineales bacterium]|nr:sulfatase-like hydrolase/transferase [Anaerolineales bacterium]
EYLAMAANVDYEVGLVMNALRQEDLEKSTLVFLTADHGGHGKNHMTGLAADMTIPWVIAGPGVIPTQHLNSQVRVYDTAATAAWALGLALPGDMKGSPVSEAFDSASLQECELLMIER